MVFKKEFFSTGTFKDSKLAKRKHEDNFEMSVLEHANGKTIERHELFQELLATQKAQEQSAAARMETIEKFFTTVVTVSQIDLTQESHVDVTSPESECDDEEELEELKEFLLVNDKDAAPCIPTLPGLDWTEEFGNDNDRVASDDDFNIFEVSDM